MIPLEKSHVESDKKSDDPVSQTPTPGTNKYWLLPYKKIMAISEICVTLPTKTLFSALFLLVLCEVKRNDVHMDFALLREANLINFS